MIDQRNFIYMFYGFAADWVIVTAYVAYLAVRERRLREELDRVRRMLEESEKKA